MGDVPYKPRRTAFTAKWNGNLLGNVKVDLKGLKLGMSPIKRASTGKVVLGHWSDGLEGTIKITCQDVELLTHQNVCAWKETALVAGTPVTVNQNLYDLAEQLDLHPIDMGDATEDLHAPKCVPLHPFGISRDGEIDDLLEVEFQVYPDASLIQGSTPKMVYIWMGATEPS